MTPNTILALSPGRSRIGYAVFREGVLLYYGGISLSRYKTVNAIFKVLDLFLQRIVTKYKVTYLAVQRLIKSQELSKPLVEIAARIKTLADSLSIFVYEYDSLAVRRQVCCHEKPTRANTAKYITEQYPELGRYYNRTRAWERTYYGFVFAAVAIGAVLRGVIKNDRRIIKVFEKKPKNG